MRSMELWRRLQSRDCSPLLPRLDLPEGAAAGSCHGLSGHFGILVDGTVVPCCLDADGVIGLGNAFETPLIDILQSERARRIRAGFAAGLI